jgi:predicted deacylase
MLHAGMLELGEGVEAASGERHAPILINASSWVRSPEGGVFRTTKRIGDAVNANEVVGHVANPYEDSAAEVRAPRRGILIGRTTLPIVNMGDALLNIGWSEEVGETKASPERDLFDEPAPDEDEMVE